MVSGMHKSRTMRRIMTRTPGGKVKKTHALRRSGFALCQKTNVKLHGVPRGRPSDIAKIPRSARRPERPFGGVLSSKAARELIIKEARSINK